MIKKCVHDFFVNNLNQFIFVPNERIWKALSVFDEISKDYNIVNWKYITLTEYLFEIYIKK